MVAWLREVLDAAQQRAEAAAKETGSTDWEYQAHGSLNAMGPSGFMVAVGSQDYLDPAPGQFMADNDPAAVLRRIVADRKLLELHTTPHTVVELAVEPVGESFCVECDGPCTHKGEAECVICGKDGCDTMRLLAEAWGWTEEEQR